MPRGSQDGSAQAYGFASQETDVGAVYQYLWGWSPIDSQGRPFYLDTFNNGVDPGWRLSWVGAGVAPSIVSGGGLAYSPPNSVQLNPGVVANDRSYFFREMYMGTTLRLGFEAAIRLYPDAPETRIQFDYKPASVVNGGLPILRWLPSAGAWQLWTAGGWVSVFIAGALPASQPIWIQVKIVADFSMLNTFGGGRGKYVRLLIGDQIIDTSGLVMDASLSAYNGLLIATVTGVSTGAGSNVSQIGYVILTKDEP